MSLSIKNLRNFVKFRNLAADDSNLQFETDCYCAEIHPGELGVPKKTGEKVTKWTTKHGCVVEDLTKQIGSRYYLC